MNIKHSLIISLLVFLSLTPPALSQWMQISPIEGATVSSLAVIVNNLFAGIQGYGIYRSTNNGLNWTEADSGISSGYLEVKKLQVVNETTLYAVTNAGLY